MPSAPNDLARVASSGVSAFAQTFNPRDGPPLHGLREFGAERTSSAHVKICMRSFWSSRFGLTRGTLPTKTWPVEPSTDAQSPS